MEKEENKKNCCESKECCGHEMTKCCHNWKKCHIVKRIILLVIVIIAFCAGSEWGEMKALNSRDYRFERGFRMMDLNYGRLDNEVQKESVTGKQATDQVTIKVNEATTPKQ